ncbi:MAG: hypothetical protein L6R42_005931 [Xanthoria sp. 1 TBL-2021]|nr:MAG: hypothetical protein L6R42_005931 [Xanthoria sp. 1 TBL-2021]
MSGSVTTLPGDLNGSALLDDQDPMSSSFMSHLSTVPSHNTVGGGNAAESDDEEESFKNPELEHTITLVGNVKDRTVIIMDDLIDQCGSWIAAAETVVKRGGAQKVYCIATHGLFGYDSLESMEGCECIDFVVVTNTYPISPERIRASRKLVILDISNLLSEAIRRNHNERDTNPVHRRTLFKSIRPKKTPSKSLLDNLTLYKDEPQTRAQAYLTSSDLTVARTFRVRTRDGYGWACRVLTVTRIAAVSRILLLSIRSRESDVRRAKGALFRDAVVLHILETFGDSLDVVTIVIFVADAMSVISIRRWAFQPVIGYTHVLFHFPTTIGEIFAGGSFGAMAAITEPVLGYARAFVGAQRLLVRFQPHGFGSPGGSRLRQEGVCAWLGS